MEHNQFLRSFLTMRANLHKTGSGTATGPSTKKETKAVANPEGITLAHIVENKPPVKDVIAYFQTRCEVLNQD